MNKAILMFVIVFAFSISTTFAARGGNSGGGGSSFYCLKPMNNGSFSCTNKSGDCVMSLSGGMFYPDKGSCMNGVSNNCINAFWWDGDSMCCSSFQIVTGLDGSACPAGTNYMPSRTALLSPGSVACCGP